MFPTFGSSNIPPTFPSNANNMNSTFGQPSNTASTFGQLGAPNCGTSQNLSPFARPSNAFGQIVNNEQTLKNPLFGNNATNLFSNNASNLFGNSNKSIFGQQNSIKSSNQMETTNQNPGFKMFESLGFAGTSKDQLGTPVKFKPTKDNESLFKGGLNHNLIITYQSLTCMKEYENKSFEELRLEDYQLNRKGAQLAYVVNNLQPSTTPFFNNPSTNTASANSVFNQPSFGQNSASPGFGQNNTGFNTSMKNTQGGIFINPTFGTSTSKSSSPFNTNIQSNNLFQSNSPNPQLAFPTQNSVAFGQSLGFGNQFGSNQTAATTNQTNNLFSQNTNFCNQNKITPFKFSSPLAANTSNTTGQVPGMFSTTTTTASNLNQTLFGQTNQGKLLTLPTNNTMPLFGQRQKPAIGGGGFPISSFGGSETKPCYMFNNNPARNFGGLPSTSLGNQRNIQENQSHPQQILNMLTTPYGATNLLSNILSNEPDLNNYKKITNPEELKSILKNIETSKSPAKKNSTNKAPIFERKDSVFFGLEYYDENLITNTRINNNPKRLFIRKKTSSINLIESPTVDNHIMENEKLESESDISSVQNSLEEVFDDQENQRENNIICASNEIATNTEDKDELQTETNNMDNTDYSIATTDINQPTFVYLGIILTRPEYYTVPSLKELVDYLNKDGSCFVQGFTIGRYGYGSVYFPDTFDVSNLNLDELVHFCNKEITIYPDESMRPPVGQGLNRRAQITLDRVWPRDKITKTLITDVDTLVRIDYANKLRKLCEKQETRFVEYRPDTGSWVFKVDHF